MSDWQPFHLWLAFFLALFLGFLPSTLLAMRGKRKPKTKDRPRPKIEPDGTIRSRVTVDDWPQAGARPWIVLCNSVEVPQCYEADPDPERGYALFYKWDANRRPYPDPDMALMELARGGVRGQIIIRLRTPEDDGKPWVRLRRCPYCDIAKREDSWCTCPTSREMQARQDDIDRRVAEFRKREQAVGAAAG